MDTIKASRLESKQEIEPEILDEVARALKIPVEAIKNFDEDAAISVVANTLTDFKDKCCSYCYELLSYV